MFLEKIKSDGIAHISYMIGARGSAAVIDPRRDIDAYLKIARAESANITHIFETHKNEDYVIGSTLLADRTGAEIYHGHAFDFQYGNGVKEGDAFEIGNLVLRIIETPGHTLESVSIALFDSEFGDRAVGVFTGDTLFIGDVGRTDFYPERAEDVAGLLYDSIFEKLLPLGDQTLLFPAHGAGSVCGSGMAAREFSTLGYERMFNPVLQKCDRDEFVRYKVNEHHDQPPYFRMMEKLNREGPPLYDLPTALPAMTCEEFARGQAGGMQAVDTRSPEAFGGASILGCMSIPLTMLPAFAGWLLSYDSPIGLIMESSDDLDSALRHLYRLGYDNVAGYLAGGLHKWETEGRPYQSIPAIHATELRCRIESHEQFTLLDVRSEQEFNGGHLPNAVNVYVGELPTKIGQVPTEEPVVTFCDSGRRAAIAASILKGHGFENVQNCLGSMQACLEVGCEVVSQTKEGVAS